MLIKVVEFCGIFFLFDVKICKFICFGWKKIFKGILNDLL